MLTHLEDRCWQHRNEVCAVQCLSQPQHKIVAREVDTDRLPCLGGGLEGDRCGVQISNELIEDGLQVWVARLAGRISRTPLKEDIKGPFGCLRDACEGIHLRGEDRIEDHATQVCRIQAHDGERQSGAIGNPVQMTLAELKIDPTLHNNVGPTQTLALLPGSLAIDTVPGSACAITITDLSGQSETITTDQRGDPRPDGSEETCDSGAYESS